MHSSMLEGSTHLHTKPEELLHELYQMSTRLGQKKTR
ncbi:hypothetical protein TNCV_1575511, partial [Trichonephila clavipes]